MANITVSEGTAKIVKTDTVGGVEYGVVKLDMGTAGVANPFSGTIPEITNIAGGTIAMSLGTIAIGTVVGNIAHDAADSGNPLKIGGKAGTTEPTAVTHGRRVDGYFDANGYLHIKTRPDTYATDDSAMPATPVIHPVGGEFRVTPTTYTDGDATVDQADVNGNKKVTLATGLIRTVDTMSVAHATDVVMNDKTELTPLFATARATAAGTVTAVAAVASKKIRVLSGNLSFNAASTVNFQSGTAGTADISKNYYGAANTSTPIVFSNLGHYETVAGSALCLVAQAGTVDLNITYLTI